MSQGISSFYTTHWGKYKPGWVTSQDTTWEVFLDDILHPDDHGLPNLKVLLRDPVLPGCFSDARVHGPQLGGGGGRQGAQLVLLLFFLIDQSQNVNNKIQNPYFFNTVYRDEWRHKVLISIPLCSSCVSSLWCVCVLLVCSQCAQNRACISIDSLGTRGTAVETNNRGKSNQFIHVFNKLHFIHHLMIIATMTPTCSC